MSNGPVYFIDLDKQKMQQELTLLRKIADWVDKVCNECPSRIHCLPDDCWMWDVHDAFVDYQAWKEGTESNT